MEVAKQVRAVMKANLHGVQQVQMDPIDPMSVNIAFEGAPGTPFDGRQLFMTVKFPSNYPYGRPMVKFHHPLYHPNVYPNDYRLCWSDDDNTASTYHLEGIIGMVNTVMGKPNPGSPANSDAARLYLRDVAAWFRTARDKAADVLFKA